jgi:hypothetical protein
MDLQNHKGGTPSFLANFFDKIAQHRHKALSAVPICWVVSDCFIRFLLYRLTLRNEIDFTEFQPLAKTFKIPYVSISSKITIYQNLTTMPSNNAPQKSFSCCKKTIAESVRCALSQVSSTN